MLESRRVLELGNRVHWYMIWLSVGIFFYYLFALFYDINTEYMTFLSSFLSTFLLFSLVFGIWNIVYALAIFIQDKIFPTRIFIFSVVRIILILIIDVIYSLILHVAGRSIII